MKRILLSIVIGLILSSCCKKIYQPMIELTTQKDSVRIEYKEVIREVPIEIPIPIEKLVNVTPSDTTSILQTSLAKSTAELKDGLLWHTLENRQDNKPEVIIPVKDTQRDSVSTITVEKRIPYPVPAVLTKWQKFRMDVGGWFMGATLLLVVFFIIRKKFLL